MPSKAMSWETNSGCPGQAAPVTRLPSVKQRWIGSGSSQGSAPEHHVELHSWVRGALLPLHINQSTSKEVSDHMPINVFHEMLQEYSTQS